MSDIYADDKEPEIRPCSITVRVNVPGEFHSFYAFVDIDAPPGQDEMYGADALQMVQLGHYRWNSENRPVHYNSTENKRHWELTHEIYCWLVEWELAQLVAIGPEDSEYFATDKLIKLAKEVSNG